MKDGKDAHAWYREGLDALRLAGTADYGSEFLDDHRTAVEAFENAIELEPDHVDAWHRKGIALDVLKRHEDALAAFTRLLDYRPDDGELWLRHAITLAKLGRHDMAVASWKEALHRRPNDVEAWHGLAASLENLGHLAEALAAWGEVMRPRSTVTLRSDGYFGMYLHTSQREAGFCAAHLLVRLGRRVEALAAYEQLIGPGARDLVDLRPFVEAIKNTEEARAAFARLLERTPDDRSSWIRAGYAYLKAGRSAEALTAFNSAIRLEPEAGDVLGWCGKAEALEQVGQNEAAASALREALRIKPDNVVASARLRGVLWALSSAS